MKGRGLVFISNIGEYVKRAKQFDAP